MTSPPPAELSQCSAFGCNSTAVTVNNLFGGVDPEMGIKFQFCEDHNAYYQYIITIVNNCLRTIQDTGQWVYQLPPTFPAYQKLLADARAKRGQGAQPPK